LVARLLGRWLQARSSSSVPVIGFLNTGSHDLTERLVQTFLQRLRESGFVEGRNVAIE
jgi:hypothetical protein